MSDTKKCAQCGSEIVLGGWVSTRQATYYTMPEGLVALCTPKCEQRWVELQAAAREAAANVDRLGEESP